MFDVEAIVEKLASVQPNLDADESQAYKRAVMRMALEEALLSMNDANTPGPEDA